MQDLSLKHVTLKEKKALQFIASYLQHHDETVAVSESVTAGLIQSRFSLAKNAMLFFHGGITTYNLGQKARLLRIDPILAERTNCVSDVIARDMAVNVAELFICTWGLGITGYAVPVPALGVDHCFAHYAFSYRGHTVLEGKLETKRRGALQVQHYYATSVIDAFASYLMARA